jgi:putative ABC transport system permease protein
MWLFELLLRLYPAGFRGEYGAVVTQQFQDEWKDAASTWTRMAMLVRSIAELLWLWPQFAFAEIAQDARYGWRSWRKRFAVTALAILALAMAIGVSAGVFTVVNAMLYASLPFREPARLVHFDTYFAPASGRAAFDAWRKGHEFLSAAGVFSTSEFNLNQRGGSLRVKGVETTADFFRLLGAPLFLGRDFLDTEELPGKGEVAVISHALYEQAFGGDSRILGQTIRLNGHGVTVVGVAAPRFDYPHNAAIWMPLVFDASRIPKSGVSQTTTMGRLRDGIHWTQAQAMFRVAAPRHKDPFFGEDPGDPQPKMLPLRDALGGEVSQGAKVLLAGVCAVLLIACANLAHLFQSRYGERSMEFHIREWLGAGKGRIAQQIMTECIGIALAAAVLGLGFTWLIARAVAHYFPPVFAFQSYEVLDWRVLAFVVTVSIGCGISFGMAPVLMRGHSGRRTNRFRLAVLGGQVALTAVLLLASLDFGFGLLTLYRTDFGYQTGQTETATVSLAGTRYETETGQREYLRRCLDLARGVSGVYSAGAIDYLPLSANSFMAGRFRVQSKPEPQLALTLTASPGLIESIGGTLLAGRDFTARDTSAALPVALVNERFALMDGGVLKVLGKKLRTDSKQPAPTIVGVVRNFRFSGPSESTIATVIRPLEQVPANFFTITARRRAGAMPVAAQLQAALQSVDPTVAVYDVMPFSRRLERSMARPNFYAIVLGFFGGFALLLTMIHGYSLCATTLERRKREMGIRCALGATMGQLRWLIVREMAPALCVGLLLGVLISIYAVEPLRLLLEDLQSAPVLTRAGGIAVLAVTALLSIWFKTRALLKVGPMESIRAD